MFSLLILNKILDLSTLAVSVKRAQYHIHIFVIENELLCYLLHCFVPHCISSWVNTHSADVMCKIKYVATNYTTQPQTVHGNGYQKTVP